AAGQPAGHQGRGAARGDAVLRRRPHLDDGRPGLVPHGDEPLRRGAGAPAGEDRGRGQGGARRGRGGGVTARRRSRKTLGGLVVGAGLLLALAAHAQEPTPAPEAPLQAGAEGVPVPKRTKTVPPEYPAEAQAQGVRGIVILELVVDPQGKVASVNVLRSVPGLDAAAVEAAKQWEYEITKVGGKPV